MFRRVLTALATVTVSGALVVPAPAAAGMPALAPAGSLGDWQQGQWWIEAGKLKSWHDQGITGTGVTIALVDGPVFAGIPELQGQDVRPTGTICDRAVSQAWGPTTPDGPLDATSFHTTSMAAVMVGSGKGNGPGGVGVLGVAPGATLKTYAMFNSVDPAANQNYDCFSPAVPGLIDRIVADGANIIEIPVSVDVKGDEIQAAFNRAIAKGVVIVSAAGNGGPSTSVMSPGGNAGVLVVAGMRPDGSAYPGNPTSLDQDWDTAQTVDGQYNIHLVAPGVDIVGGALVGGNRWDSAVLQSGTSGASAIVAGQLALMKQKWPKATGNQLLYSLLRSARRPEGSPVWDPRRGLGTTYFEGTLTTDPTAYPDVVPIYRTLGNVFNDHPTAPFMPLAVNADGYLPKAANGSATASAAAPSSPAVEPAPANATAASATAQTTSPTAWVAWLLGGLLVVAVLVGGGWMLTRNRRPGAGSQTSSDSTTDSTTDHAPARETAVHAGGPPAGSGRQGEDSP